jgi:hypothetical protein
MVLVSLALTAVVSARNTRLDHQERTARAIIQRFGTNLRIVSIGRPEILVLLNRANPTRYLFFFVGIDRHIDARTVGGFRGWLRQIEAFDPDVIAFGPTRGIHEPELMGWLAERYRKEPLPAFYQGEMYVRKSERR